MISQQTSRPAYVYAILSIVLWATAASSFKIALRHLDILQILWISSLTSLLILLGFAIASGRVFTGKTISVRDARDSALRGLLNPFLYYIVLFNAYNLLPAQIAQPLNFTWPIVLVILSAVFLRQKLKARHLLAMSVSFVGVILISTRGKLIGIEWGNSTGILLATGSSFIWAVYWILNMQSKVAAIPRLFLNFLFASIYSTIALLVFSTPLSIPWQGWLSGIYVGCFEMGFTFFFWMKALELSGNTRKIGNLIYLTPFFSLLCIHLVLGESIYYTTFAGLVLIVTGILVQDRIK